MKGRAPQSLLGASILVITAWLLLSGPILAATYYVDCVNGLNSRTTIEAQNPATPWKTITYASTMSASGAIISVAPGLYNQATGEAFPINLTGRKLLAQVTYQATIDSGTPAVNTIAPGANSTIEGFTIKNSSTSTNHTIYVNSTNVYLFNNYIYSFSIDSSRAIYATASGTYLYAFGNIIYSGPSVGRTIELVSGANYPQILNGSVSSNAGGCAAIYLGGNATAKIEGNVITGDNGIYMNTACSNYSIQSNLIKAWSTGSSGPRYGALLKGTGTLAFNVIRGYIDTTFTYAAVFCTGAGTYTIERNTIVKNVIAIWTGSSVTANVKNNIIDSNPEGAPRTGSIGLWRQSGTLNHYYNDIRNNVTNYNNTSATASEISRPEWFVSVAGNDYHLKPNSPCINSGDPTSTKDPDNTYADMGAYYFNLSVPSSLAAYVKSPNGGELLPAAGTTDVTWYATSESSDPVSRIEIYYSTNEGVSFNGIVTTETQNDGSFIWSLPDIVSTKARIRIVAVNSAYAATAESDSNFTIRRYASDYYVNSTIGSDTYDGTSPTVIGDRGPFKTITYACSMATNPSKIHVAAGTYSAGETFGITVPTNVHLISDAVPSTTATVDAGAAQAFTMNAASTIEGFTIKSTTQAITVANSSATIKNNLIKATNYGITVNSGYSDVIIANNTIEAGSWGVGISFAGSNNKYTVYNNVIRGLGGSTGITGSSVYGGSIKFNVISGFTNGDGYAINLSVATPAYTCAIENNTVVDNGTGINALASGTSLVNIKNNIVCNRARLGYLDLNGSLPTDLSYGIYTGTRTFISYNDIWNCSSALSSTLNCSNNTFRYPRFVSPEANDYRIYQDSPCAISGEGGTFMGKYAPLAETSNITAESWVDDNASDGNPGTEALPFKTIKKARSVTEYKINVKEGLYDTVNGETFPMDLSQDQYLRSVALPISIAATLDAGTTGKTLSNLGSCATLEGFYLTNNAYTEDFIRLWGGTAEVKSNTIVPKANVSRLIEIDNRFERTKILNNAISNPASTTNYDIYLQNYAKYCSIEGNSLNSANANSVYVYVQSSNTANISISRNYIKNTKSTGAAIEIGPAFGAVGGFNITGNTIEVAGKGIYQNAQFGGNTISNKIVGLGATADYGIYLNNDGVLTNKTASNEIRGFTGGTYKSGIYSNATSGILFVENNTIAKNLYGVRAAGTGSLTVKNCIISSSPEGTPLASSYGVYRGGTLTVNCSYSDVYNNTNNYAGGVTLGSGTIEAEAQFHSVANNDYHLWGTSPCRGTGTPIGTDMGAYPYGALIPAILLVPNGGEKWRGGSTREISWFASETDDSFKLYYITSEAVGFQLISGEVPGISRSYNWSVPLVNSTQAKVSIEAHEGPEVYWDQSDSVFTIDSEPPLLKLSQPVGGETTHSLTTYTITWEASDNFTPTEQIGITINFSSNEGSSWTFLAQPPNTGSYGWDIPYIYTDQARISIEARDQCGNVSIESSRSNFTIAPLPLTVEVTSPSDGQNWRGGVVQTISWTAFNPIEKFILYYTSNEAGGYQLINDNVSGLSRSYAWPAPAVNTSQAKISIEALREGNVVSDQSTFTLDSLPPALRLFRPLGGETYQALTTMEITWEASDNYTPPGSIGIGIYYSGNAGVSWSLLTQEVNDGSYIWDIPDLFTDQARIGISAIDLAGNSSWEASRSNFTITWPPLSVSLSVPNSGESWYADTIQNITWEAGGYPDHFNLYYTAGDPMNYQTIISDLPGTSRSYSWWVPNLSTSEAKVKIEVVRGAEILTDESSGFFTIIPSTMRVVTNCNDSGAGSLRQVISDANANPGHDTITFNIPTTEAISVGGVWRWRINVPTGLDSLSEQVCINGASQPTTETYQNPYGPEIELRGPGSQEVIYGLTIDTSDCLIHGLAINAFKRGISINSGSFNHITGNYIGLDATGTTSESEGKNLCCNVGIDIRSANNVIGGSDLTERNVISRNIYGIYIIGGNYNQVKGNYLGTSASGDKINISPTAYIGNGIFIAGNCNLIGGVVPGEGNVISGNVAGIILEHTLSNEVKGNYIGTGPGGTSALGNYTGIEFVGINSWDSSEYNIIGGTGPGERNLISGNDHDGIYLYGDWVQNNKIIGNYIGLDKNRAPLGNSGHGVFNSFDPKKNQLGPGNYIAYNAQAGVYLAEETFLDITQNSFEANVDQGIDMQITGGNSKILAPTVKTATYANGLTYLTGTAESYPWLANPSRIEVFKTEPTPGADNQGEGLVYLGSVMSTTYPSRWTATVAGLNPGDKVTATATKYEGYGGYYTSEFAKNFTVEQLTVTLEAPNGGEYWVGNTVNNITWQASVSPEYFRLYYITSEAIGYKLITGAVTGDKRSYAWLVPNVPQTTTARVSIEAVSGPVIARDESAATFTITKYYPPNIVYNCSDQNIPGSLRYVLNSALAAGGNWEVLFAITTWEAGYSTSEFSPGLVTNEAGGDTWYRIIVDLAELPTLSKNKIYIHGSTQAQEANNPKGPKVEVRCQSGKGYDGITVTANYCTIEGLVINGFNLPPSGEAGIKIEGGQNNQIRGCYIGTTATGEAGRKNNYGIYLTGNYTNNNIIGGSGLGERNLISGNNYGIRILGYSGGSTFQPQSNIIKGNYIGTNRTGMAAVGNSGGIYSGGIFFHYTSNNTIGGATPAERNVISGNSGNGVVIEYSDNNNVWGNYIGTNVNGDAVIPNISGGIQIYGSDYLGNTSLRNMIGGKIPGQGNVISGNSSYGIGIYYAPSNEVKGNYIGTDSTGTYSLGNQGPGVQIFSLWVPGTPDNIVGGTKEAERNIISGNTGPGVSILGVSAISDLINTQVKGNYIGTDVSGTYAVPNDQGVSLTEGVTTVIVGGTKEGEANIISGNNGAGIYITESNTNEVKGNLIGVNKDHDPLGNQGDGITLAFNSYDNHIGPGNWIGYNKGHGVYLKDFVGPLYPCQAIHISRNTMEANTGKGIKLDFMANNSIDPPEITGLETDGIHTYIRGTTHSWYATSEIEVFAAEENPGPDNQGEGKYYLGSTITDAAGNWLATVEGWIQNRKVTATLTHYSSPGDTSEFALNYLAPRADRDNIVYNCNDDGWGSLRHVLTSAEAAWGNWEVIFDITTQEAGYSTGEFSPGLVTNEGSGNTWYRIIVDKAELPHITAPNIYLHGSTQTREATNSPGPKVEVRCASGKNYSGLYWGGTESTIEGLVINGFNSPGKAAIYMNSWYTLVKNCYLGTTATGEASYPNRYGIYMYGGKGNQIGDGVGGGNLISGNSSYGIILAASSISNQIKDNLIGTDKDGIENLGNADNGIIITSCSNNQLGPRNLIAYNGGSGISVQNSSTNILITQNSMEANAGKGILLGAGSNNDIQKPVITSAAYYGGSTVVTGSSPSGASLEVFKTEPTPGPDDQGEGLVYLGTVSAEGTSWVATVGGLNLGDKVTATASKFSSPGYTSEFALNAMVEFPSTPVILHVSREADLPGSAVHLSWDLATTPDIYVLYGDGTGSFTNEASSWSKVTNPATTGYDVYDRYLLHASQVGTGSSEVYYKALYVGQPPSDLPTAEAVGKVNFAIMTYPPTLELFALPLVSDNADINAVIGTQFGASLAEVWNYTGSGWASHLYNGSTWAGSLPGGQMVKDRAYWIKNKTTNKTLTFVGRVLSSSESIGFNDATLFFYGNPYPRTVTWTSSGLDSIFSTNDQVWQWDSGWKSKKYDGANTWSGTTLPGLMFKHGFWIKKHSAVATWNFTKPY